VTQPSDEIIAESRLSAQEVLTGRAPLSRQNSRVNPLAKAAGANPNTAAIWYRGAGAYSLRHRAVLAGRRKTMAYEYILVEQEDGVGIVTLNRPDKLNAMNRKLAAELREAVKAFDADDQIGCIIMTGAGEKAFSAGGDIHEQREDDRRFTQDELDARRGRGSYEIAASAKPTIGMINGLAYGGAAVLASSLDMRVGCEATRFRFLAAAYGRINSTWTLPNQVGWPIAKELLFTARVVEAEEAYRIGLLNHLVPGAQLRAKTLELARMIAGNNRAAIAGIKTLLLKQMAQTLEQQWEEERHFTTHVLRGARAEEAFPEFIARHGRPLG
jgi:enoyl-CoA hydratase/carnithine racemase